MLLKISSILAGLHQHLTIGEPDPFSLLEVFQRGAWVKHRGGRRRCQEWKQLTMKPDGDSQRCGSSRSLSVCARKCTMLQTRKLTKLQPWRCSHLLTSSWLSTLDKQLLNFYFLGKQKYFCHRICGELFPAVKHDSCVTCAADFSSSHLRLYKDPFFMLLCTKISRNLHHLYHGWVHCVSTPWLFSTFSRAE